MSPQTDSRKSGSDAHDRKIGLSCAECRRSKLKCDRVFPCQSCVRRGCANICPNGTLAATKGNKVLLAHAEKLSVQVKTLTKRIHELENELSKYRQASPSCSTTTTESYDASDGVDDSSENLSSLSIDIDHIKTESDSQHFHDMLIPTEAWPPKAPKVYCLPVEIIELMNAFPLGVREDGFEKHLFLPYIPQRERALELVELYYRHVAFLYYPVTRDDFMTNVMHPIYGQTGDISLEHVHPHALALFFVVLASGLLHDFMLPERQSHSTQYIALSRAAFAVLSIIEEANCASVQTLFLIVQYDFHFDHSSAEERWLLHGLCIRVALRIGLHRDSAGSGIKPEEVQWRRHLFWELYIYDGWSSVANGRPPALNLQFADCRFPEEPEAHSEGKGVDREISYRGYLRRYFATCLNATIQLTLNRTPPSYQGLLALDKQLRQYPVPQNLQTPALAPDPPPPWPSDPAEALTLKSLHRRAREAVRTGVASKPDLRTTTLGQSTSAGAPSRSPSQRSSGSLDGGSPWLNLVDPPANPSIDFYQTFGNPLAEANYLALNASVPGIQVTGTQSLEMPFNDLFTDQRRTSSHSIDNFPPSIPTGEEWAQALLELDQVYLNAQKTFSLVPSDAQMDDVMHFTDAVQQQHAVGSASQAWPFNTFNQPPPS
ncbi:hypothetical protein ONZ45_g6088 [Pleurotus djamor]|nr:hypothetical protein ONZ45_g6088 [Pleurotus djamor]